MNRLLVLTLLVATTLAAAARSQDAQLPDPRSEGLEPDQRLEALIERVRLEQERIETLEADFGQVKESEMLLEPSEASGVFSYAAPDRVRWEFLSPDPISLLIRGDEMSTWYRDLYKVEIVQVGRQSQRVLEYLGASNSLKALLDYFYARLHLPGDPSQPFQLHLEPRFERVAKRLQSMSLWIDSERFVPLRLQFVEADGDLTEYRFENLRINQGLPEERFELDLPASVEVRSVDLARAGRR